MADMAHLLAKEPLLRWVEGKVLRITGDYLTISYNGGEVDNVARLSTYTPAPGDIVQMLAQSGIGFLVLGVATKTGSGIGPLPTESAVTVSADSAATWHVGTTASAWEPGVLAATGPADYGVWLYDVEMLAAAGKSMLTSFEIEVSMASGGPAEFFLHNQAGAVGNLSVLSPGRYVTSWEPYSAMTWVPLPLGWGEDLIAGRARGIGVGGGMFSATWVAGGGRLRFTGV